MIIINKSMSGGTKIIPITIAILLSVLTVYLIDLIWRESVGEVAPAGSLVGNPTYAEHNTPWVRSVNNPLPKVAMFAEVSAYSSTPDQTSGNPFITASGQRVHDGVIANNCLEFGTKVVFEGKEYEVLDRMNRRYGCDNYDIWKNSRSEALAFGRQQLEITYVGK